MSWVSEGGGNVPFFFAKHVWPLLDKDLLLRNRKKKPWYEIQICVVEYEEEGEKNLIWDYRRLHAPVALCASLLNLRDNNANQDKV